MAAILKYFLICKLICLLIGPYAAFCQEEKPEMKRDFTPAALRIGISVTDLLQPFIYGNLEKAYAVQADLSIDRFMLVADVGAAQYARAWEPQDTLAPLYQYNTKGNYFKVGVDVNFLKDKEANTRFAKDDVIFWGLRYANSAFSANATFDLEDSVWGDFIVMENHDKLRAWWIEMVAGIKVEVFRNVFLGYTMQFRFLKNFSQESPLTPYDVPGFGSGNRNTVFGFDYYLFYRIPFR
jgi:Domain of unknown function (DUF6048)